MPRAIITRGIASKPSGRVQIGWIVVGRGRHAKAGAALGAQPRDVVAAVILTEGADRQRRAIEGSSIRPWRKHSPVVFEVCSHSAPIWTAAPAGLRVQIS
jgi:hypothetical protein